MTYLSVPTQPVPCSALLYIFMCYQVELDIFLLN